MIVFHIFLKDLRRHWREVASFLAVTAGWAWQQAHPGMWTWPDGKTVLPILFFLLWFFIVVRVIHGELLVGDREFWMTRPYEWDALLMAKAIFLVLALNVPLLAMQAYLLIAADLPFSLAWIRGLFFLQLLFALFFTLPAAALAAVTESLVQWIAAAAGLGIFAMIVSWLPWDRRPPTLNEPEEVAWTFTILVVAAAVLLATAVQFARRRRWPAIGVMAVALLAIPMIAALSSNGLLRSAAYPRSSEPLPIQLMIRGTATNDAHEYTLNGLVDKKLDISIPIAGAATAPDTLVQIEGAQVTLNGDGNWRWQSAWSKENIWLTNDAYQGALSFYLPRDVADQLKGRHITAKAEFAIAAYKLSSPKRIETAAGRFEIPEIGFCRWDQPGAGRFFHANPECRAALRLPDVLVSRMDSGENTCTENGKKPDLPAGHSSIGITWDESPFPADFDPDPVHTLEFGFTGWSPAIPDAHNPGRSRTALLCRGTPITVRTGTLSGRMRVTVDLGNLGNQKIVDPNAGSDPDE
jgi:hypothetical protein